MIPAQAQEFPVTTTFANVISGRGVLVGWAIKETTGAATAVVNIRDGLGGNGLLLAPINLAANESTRDWFSDWGISFSAGVCVDVDSGSVSGSLWIIPQGLMPAEGTAYAYSQGPSTDGYPSLGIEGLQ